VVARQRSPCDGISPIAGGRPQGIAPTNEHKHLYTDMTLKTEKQRSILHPLRLIRIETAQNHTPGMAAGEEEHDRIMETSGATIPTQELGAQQLLRRTPASYLLNQAYGLSVFVSLFLLTLIMTHTVSVTQYGIYAIAATAYNTIAYVVAFGLEDAANTYVPRLLTEHGPASAAWLMRRLLALRVAILAVSLGMMLFALPYISYVFAAVPLPTFGDIARGLRSPDLLRHITPIAFWVLGNGIASLFTALYAAMMRMRLVFIAGSLAQVLLLALSFVTLRLGWGIDSVLWLQAACALLTAVALAAWQGPLLLARGANYRQPLRPVLRLGLSAWFINLVSGALLKQISVIILVAFAFSAAQVAFFTLSYQLAHAASLLLVSGFGGVGISALAAAYVGMNHARLARAWQSLIKIETLLAAPVLVFSLFNAPAIALALYGASYSAVGSLFIIFLFFNILVRALGTTIHQSALYVVGRPRQVVLAQCAGLVVVIALGILLVPRYGPAGALVADGVSQLVTGGLMLALLWQDLPEKYPLAFTLRLLLALAIAALPALAWHPASKTLLVLAGLIFLGLATGLLALVKPLSKADMAMIGAVRPGLARYVRWFGRS
jgi:O-antigen/teichoic acid export membrane protein